VDYVKFTGWFDSEKQTLDLSNDWQEFAPPGSINPSYLQWIFRWSFRLASDNKYVRIWERYEKDPKMINTSHRHSFAYHYGPLVHFDAKGAPIVDHLGTPKYDNADPVDIRIDTCRSALPHLHFGAQNPHYSQDQVRDFDMSKLDMFTFIRAIRDHRAKGVSIKRILGFKI
jgi:hypothetical protein